MSNTDKTGQASKPAPSTTRRLVGNTLFVGGLVLCGGALVQPTYGAPSVLLTNGTTGGSSGTTSGVSSGETSGGSSGTTSGGSSGTTSGNGSSGTASGSTGVSGGIFGVLDDFVSRTLAFIGGLVSTFLGLVFGRRRGSGWFG